MIPFSKINFSFLLISGKCSIPCRSAANSIDKSQQQKGVQLLAGFLVNGLSLCEKKNATCQHNKKVRLNQALQWQCIENSKNSLEVNDERRSPGSTCTAHIRKDDDWIQPSHCHDGSVVFEEDRVHFCLETSIYQSLPAEMLLLRCTRVNTSFRLIYHA